MLRLADAQRMIAAAQKKAAEIGQPMNIAVADAGGNLIAHVGMDDAWIGGIDISIKKAYTSRALDISTEGPGDAFAVGRAVLRHSRVQQWADHDFCGRHSPQEGWEGRGGHRGERRIRRSGPRGRRSRRTGVVARRTTSHS